jgi:hypothetical protein
MNLIFAMICTAIALYVGTHSGSDHTYTTYVILGMLFVVLHRIDEIEGRLK